MGQLLSPKEAADKLLVSMTQLEASDLHLKVGYPPYYRVAGHLRKVEMPPIPSSAYLEEMLVDLVPASRRHEYDERGDLERSSGRAHEQRRCSSGSGEPRRERVQDD